MQYDRSFPRPRPVNPLSEASRLRTRLEVSVSDSMALRNGSLVLTEDSRALAQISQELRKRRRDILDRLRKRAEPETTDGECGK